MPKMAPRLCALWSHRSLGSHSASFENETNFLTPAPPLQLLDQTKAGPIRHPCEAECRRIGGSHGFDLHFDVGHRADEDRAGGGWSGAVLPRYDQDGNAESIGGMPAPNLKSILILTDLFKAFSLLHSLQSGTITRRLRRSTSSGWRTSRSQTWEFGWTMRRQPPKRSQ